MFGCLVPLGRLWSFTQNHQRGEGLPSAPVTGLTFNDYDVRPGFMRGRPRRVERKTSRNVASVETFFSKGRMRPRAQHVRGKACRSATQTKADKKYNTRWNPRDTNKALPPDPQSSTRTLRYAFGKKRISTCPFCVCLDMLTLCASCGGEHPGS